MASVQSARSSSSQQGQEARSRLFGSPASTKGSEARQTYSASGSPSYARDGTYTSPSKITLADRETLHTLPSGERREGDRILSSDGGRQPSEFSQYRSSVDSVRRSGDYDLGRYQSTQAHYRQVSSPERYRENPRWSGEGEYVGSGERRGKSPTRDAFSRPLESAVPESQLLNNHYWENLTKSPYNQGYIQEIEKTVEAIDEVLVPVPVDKIVERVEENLVIVDRNKTESVAQQEIVWQIEEVTKEVPVETEVLEEIYQEEYVDKVVEKIVEVIKEIPVIKVVQRKVEVVREIPVVRYVDKIITKEIMEKRFVERVVEVIKEKPVEVIKQVPIYVMDKANSYVVQGEMYEGQLVRRDTIKGPESPARVTVHTNVVTSEAYADVAPFVVKPDIPLNTSITHIPLSSSQHSFHTHSPAPAGGNALSLSSSYHGPSLLSSPQQTPISLHSSMRENRAEFRDPSYQLASTGQYNQDLGSTTRFRHEPEPPIRIPMDGPERSPIQRPVRDAIQSPVRDPVQSLSSSFRREIPGPQRGSVSPGPTQATYPAVQLQSSYRGLEVISSQGAPLDTSPSRFASLHREQPSPAVPNLLSPTLSSHVPAPALRAAPPPPRQEEKTCGVGLVLQQMEDGTFTVLSLVPGGSAEKSERVEVDDLLVTVEGSDVKGLNLNELVALMEGPENSLVRLLFARYTPEGRIHYSVTLSRSVPSVGQQGAARPSGRKVQIQDTKDPWSFA